MSAVEPTAERLQLTPVFAQLTPKRGSGQDDTAREKVIRHQRARMFAVMIQCVGRRGYSATSIRELCALAGVSRAAPYYLFGSKEAWFRETYDLIVFSAIERVRTTYRCQPDLLSQLRSGLDVLLAYVVEQPDAARLALVEALGAGPDVLERMDRTSRAFEWMIGSTFAASPEHVALPPLVVKGIVGGISRVSRQRLLDKRVSDLSGSTDELLDWILAYHSQAGAELPPAPTGRKHEHDPDDYSLSLQPGDDTHARIMRCAAYITAKYGYDTLTVDGITRCAGVSYREFFDSFGGVPECFLEAYDFTGVEIAASAEKAALRHEDWWQAIRAGLTALLQRIADDPVFTRIAFVDVFSVGPAGIARRSNLIQNFRDLLLRRAPEAGRPSELVAEAIVGAVWEIAHHYVVRGANHLLPRLTDHATYLVLAPMIGAEEAMERLLGRA
jgi:AcrR family transcriptional regulator